MRYPSIRRRGSRPSPEVLEGRSLLSTSSLSGDYGRLPLAFEANVGQAPAEIGYIAHGAGYSLGIGPTSGTLLLNTPGDEAPTVLTSDLVGAGAGAMMASADRLPGVANYLVGDDPASWRTGVPTYAKVVTTDAYPGIDLIRDGSSGTLEEDFVIAPGADPGAIRIQFRGQDSMALDGAGNLVLHTRSGDVTQAAPVVYQEFGGTRHAVPGAFVLAGPDQVGFAIGAYDRTLPLTIDPVFGYSTFFGGAYSSGYGIAVDSSGRAFLAGETSSATFPIVDPFQASASGGTDAFLSAFNPQGTALLFSTYFGGSGFDAARAIALDPSGAIVIAGMTNSTDLPTKGAIQPERAPDGPGSSGIFGGNFDLFVAKFAPDGSSLDFSTYLGGEGDDYPGRIALDPTGDVYVAGATSSADFPTRNPIQAASRGGGDAFVTKIKADGSALVYSTYLGGAAGTGESGGDGASGIAVDAAGAAYVVGSTSSADFPTVRPIQGVNRGSLGNAFVAKINPQGSALEFSTYLGGSYSDAASAVALDASGDIYVAGTASSTDFPTAHAFQPANAGGADGFLAKLDPSGSALIFSTYIGGSASYNAYGNDLIDGLAVQPDGRATVVGQTNSRDFPTADPIQADYRSIQQVNGFVSRFDASGSAPTFSTFLGGSKSDGALDVALDPAGNIYATGYASSPDFPTFRPIGGYQGGDSVSNAFVAKIVLAAPLAATVALTATPDPVVAGLTTTLVARVVGGGISPTGTITFLDGSTSLGTVPVGVDGSAVLRVSNLGVAAHSILATYSGDTLYIPSSASTLLTVVSAPPSTTLTAFPAVPTAGQPVLLTATVQGTGGVTPTGTVTFLDGSTPLGVVPLDGSGRATLLAAGTAAGARTIVASYSGDASNPASSARISVVVEAPVTIARVARLGFHARPTRIVLSFSGPLDDAQAIDLRAYRLLEDGTGRSIRVISAAYDPTTRTVTLTTAAPLPLRRRYQLTVRGTGPHAVLDDAGRPIDGDRDGRVGGDFAIAVTRAALDERPARSMHASGARLRPRGARRG